MAKLLFELNQVCFSYFGKISALREINLTIEQGSKTALIGANGTGKSTLLAMLDALIFPDKGFVKAFDKELTESVLNDNDFSRFFRKKVGFIFQNSDVQLFCPTVKEDIVFGPLQLGIPKEEINKRLDKLTDELGISHLLNRAPYQLSIGEKKKVAIASVLAINPEVLLLDEPTAGLDPQTSRHIMDIICRENQSGKTIITATHDLHIIEEIADNIYVLGSNKSIIRKGNVCDILSDQRFLEENNLVHIHAHRHKDIVHIHHHQHLDHHS